MRMVSTSSKYKPCASLIPGSLGEHQCGVYNPRASLVPRLPWLAPVRSATPGLDLFPDSPIEPQYGLQAHGYPCSPALLVRTSTDGKLIASLIPGSPGEHQYRVHTQGLPRSQVPLMSRGTEYNPLASFVPRLP